MEDTIHHFYQSFFKLDAEGMIECYHDDVVFHDPAFGTLQGERAKNMWRMLCKSQKGKNFKVIYSDVEANENEGSAKWEAFYTFSPTSNAVHNRIYAHFKFKDGKIIEHLDDFNLNEWMKQAIGPLGALLGWTSFFQKGLRKKSNAMLDQFEAKRRAS